MSSTRSPRHLAVATLVLVILSLLAACAPRDTVSTATPTVVSTAASPVGSPTSAQATTPSPTSTATPRSGGVLKLGQPGDPASCDLGAWKGRDFRSVHTCNPMYNQLVQSDPFDHGRVLPDLATSWEVSADGTRWTFPLRQDVRWHDGTPFTSEDVLFTFNRALTPPQGFEPGRASTLKLYVDAVGAPNANTVVVRTKFPAASFLPSLASVYASIYPKHVLEKLSPPTFDAFDQAVGTGPFRPKSFTRDSVYQLRRSDTYFLPGKPYLDEVWWVSIPNDAVRFAAFKAHQLDGVPVGITEGQTQELTRDFAGRISTGEVATANFVSVTLNTQQAPFTDIRVRRAVNLALDRQAAALTQGGGAAGAYLPLGGAWMLSQAALSALPGMGAKSAERAQAKELLTQVGYSGAPVRILGRTGAYFQGISAFVQGQLKEVGIESTFESLDTAAYFARVAQRDFVLTASSNSLSLDDPDEAFGTRYLCDSPENYAGLCDIQVDALFAQQQRLLDPAARREVVGQLQQRLWDTHAHIVVLWTLRRSPVWSDVRGFVMGASNYQGMRLEHVWKAQ